MTDPSGPSTHSLEPAPVAAKRGHDETYLDELFELAPDAVVLTSLRNPRVLRVNREFTRLFGYTADETVGHSLRDLIMPDHADPTLPEDPDLLAGYKVEREVIRRRKDGTLFHAHITGKRVRFGNIEDAAYVIFRDISARKESDALFAGEKALLEVIAAGGPLAATLDSLCRLAEDIDRTSLTSILVVDRKGRHLHHGAGPSLPPTYVAAIDGAPIGTGIGPCAAAAHTGAQVVCVDMSTDDRWSAQMQALARAHGLRACWSTPIKSPAGRVLGTFAIYPREPATPTPAQLSRIEQLTHLASIAIDRAQSLDALRRSEERYAVAMDAAADGHMDWNLLTDELYVSPRMLAMIGHAPDSTFDDHADWERRFPFHPEDRRRWEEATAAHFAGQEAKFKMDFRVIVDGETRWLAFNFIATRDARAKVVRWTGSIADIHDATRDIATVLDAIPGLVAILTPTGELDAVNQELVAYCGEPLEAMKHWGTNGIVHADDLSRVGSCMAHAMATGEPYDFEARIRRFDGSYRWHQIRGLPFRDPGGRIVRWYVLLSDIDASRRAEDALRLSDERYALAMEASAEGHFDGDLTTGQMFVSARVNEIYNFPRQADMVDRKEFIDRIPFHPDDRRFHDDILRPDLVRPEWQSPTPDLFEYDCRIIPRPGDVRWIHTRGKVVRDAAGRARRRVGVIADITERKRVEEALREQTERLQLGQAAMRMIIMDWNITEDLLTWSDSPEWLRGPLPAGGYSLFKDQVHVDDRDNFLATRSRALETLEVQTTEFRLVRTDGKVIWVLERKQAFADVDGKPVRMLAAMFDITDRKRAEDELRESETRFRALTALWSDWYWRQDEQLRFTYSTAAIDPPEGYPGGSAIGKTRWELAGVVPVSTTWAEHREILAAHKPFRDFEYSRPAADGTLRYVSTSGTPIFDQKGVFRGYHGVARNITERKRIEQELRSRQEMLDVAQKAARAVAFEWRLDASEAERRWSPELEALHGLAAGSSDGSYESWKRLVHPDDWPNVHSAIIIAQETGDVDAEYRVATGDGAVRWLQAKGRMLFDPGRKPARIVGFTLDVTDRHLAQEELHRVERQLRQAQRLEALGTLAGGIAHDFNNLLGAILGYGEMALRNVRSGSRLRRDIENIMIAGERGRALVERILAFSHTGVGEQVAVHVEKVMEETMALFAAKLPSHIVIERRLRASNAAVMGDPTQIHQVLMNLLTNAVHAMPSGGDLCVSLDRVSIRSTSVVTTGTLAPREYAVLAVSDSGGGIPAEIQERIFDPFFTTKEVGVGTGLGLSLVHGIVTGLGGAIDVATAVGKGSVFKAYLPLADDIVAPGKPAKRLERKMQRTGHGRVMLIDDEEALVTLATQTLNALGYSAVGFTSSAKAIEAFMKDPQAFDAVVTDESMPGASGSEVIAVMRAARPTIPLLLVSGYLSAAVIERAWQAGATDILKKPLSARDLQSAVEHALPRDITGRRGRARSTRSSDASKRRERSEPPRSDD